MSSCGLAIFDAPATVPDMARWYAIQVRYRAEKKTLQRLTTKGVETFFPAVDALHRWSDRRKLVSTPLFSGYGFVQTVLSTETRMRVLQTEGVIGFVTVLGHAAPVPAKQIESLRLLLAKRVPFALHAFVKSGQRVRISGGALDGLEGIYQSANQSSMVVCIEPIERAISIRIQGYELELL